MGAITRPVTAGPPVAYAAVVAEHAPALLRLAVMLTGEAVDGEELLRSTLGHAARHGDRIAATTAPGGPVGELRALMVREHVSWARRLRRAGQVSGIELVEATVPPAGGGLRDEVWQWLDTLSPARRAVLVLRFHEALSVAGTAGLLGCDDGAVREHLDRAFDALRATVGGTAATDSAASAGTSWTEEQLGGLLQQTFASRAGLADPLTAQRIGAQARPRRRWPAAVAGVAVIMLLGSGAAYAVSRNGDDRTPTPLPRLVAPVPTGSDARNRALAARESERVLGLVDVPAGSVRRPSEPPAAWGHYWLALSGHDPLLGRTAWYVVPMTPLRLGVHLAAHTPAGMEQVDDVSHGPDGSMTLTYAEPRAREPAAYSPVELLLQWRALGGRTLLKASTYTTSRFVRGAESYVTGRVSTVDIVRSAGTDSTDRAAGPLPTVHLSATADAADVAALAEAVNALAGSTTVTGYRECPAGHVRETDVVTFHTDEGALAYRLEPTCWGQVLVRRDDRPLSTTLDPGDLDTVVDRIAARH
ncbi:sigma factor-like helix-turn-helix DNA-binding protein [Nocardioides cheoyonin]|uniref:sigma factor-like helix-turn-helix DNA-binding protein n=1 Tax=Nocardioides cheoyonin TaxID=3156615 RepID=UPI0032B510FC